MSNYTLDDFVKNYQEQGLEEALKEDFIQSVFPAKFAAGATTLTAITYTAIGISLGTAKIGKEAYQQVKPIIEETNKKQIKKYEKNNITPFDTSYQNIK